MSFLILARARGMRTWSGEFFFLEEDAEIVSSILVHEGMDDIQAWHYNKRSIHSKIGLQGLY